MLRIIPPLRPVAEVALTSRPVPPVFPWALVILGASGGSLALLAAVLGVARPDAAIIGAAVIGLLTFALALLDRPTPPLPSLVQTAPLPTPDREPPYALMLEDIADPILMTSATVGSCSPTPRHVNSGESSAGKARSPPPCERPKC